MNAESQAIGRRNSGRRTHNLRPLNAESQANERKNSAHRTPNLRPLDPLIHGPKWQKLRPLWSCISTRVDNIPEALFNQNMSGMSGKRVLKDLVMGGSDFHLGHFVKNIQICSTTGRNGEAGPACSAKNFLASAPREKLQKVSNFICVTFLWQSIHNWQCFSKAYCFENHSTGIFSWGVICDIEDLTEKFPTLKLPSSLWSHVPSSTKGSILVTIFSYIFLELRCIQRRKNRHIICIQSEKRKSLKKRKNLYQTHMDPGPIRGAHNNSAGR